MLFSVGIFWRSHDQKRAAEALGKVRLYGAHSGGQRLGCGGSDRQRYVPLQPMR